MKLHHLLAASFLTLSVAACDNSSHQNTSADSGETAIEQLVQGPAKPVLGAYGIATENMDLSVKPGDNFFKFVNGTWLTNTEIPADKDNYGGFSILADLSQERVKAIIEEASDTNAPLGSEEQKIGDLYAAFMDTAAIEAAAVLMANASLGIRSPIAPFISVDLKNVKNYVVYLTQAGLGMPNRSYYLDEGETSDSIRAAYVTYLETMLQEADVDQASKRAKRLMAFETDLARVHWTPTKRRNRSLTYNKRSLVGLKQMAGGIPWDAMLAEAGLGDQNNFVVRETDAIEGTAKIFKAAGVETLKDYMTAHYMGSNAAYLPKRIDDARFNFYSKTLRGTEVQRERWKRGVGQIDGMLGEIVGKVYVKKHFPPIAKTEMDKLIENLRSAFKDGIDNLEWMDPVTKTEAQNKLAKFNPKIGYPDKWTDYSDLKVDRDDLIGTVKTANAWAWNDEIKKLGGPIDRDEWAMNPQTVNAYYRPDLNEIVFPAAILQAPFFDAAADPAVNYGGIGAVIGHEMGHGFDDQGRKTDGNGEQRDWWTEEDGKAFEERSKALVEQFNAFEPLPGEHVNGELTLGENIGDLTGLTMAYAAYKKSLNGTEAPIIDGMTGDQRFFLAFGQIWQRKFRDAALLNRIKTDPHSPGEYRANGIVRNFDAWYEAFDVQPDDALYLPPEKRVKIW